jgi:hypothetical protein
MKVNLTIGSVLLTGLFFLQIQGLAQNADSNLFTPYGTPIIQIFGDYYTGISEENHTSSLEIRRSYFGYSYQFKKEFSAVVKLDIGSPEDVSEFARIRRYAYFKNAFLDYKTNKLKISVGIIDLLHFKMQENYWGHRYIYKSLADEHRFGPTADIGASVSYSFLDWLDADFTFMNGEGYTNPQLDNTFKGGFGVTVKPLKKLVLRSYYDLMVKSVTTSTLALFVGYEPTERLIAGGEFNLKLNDEFENDHNRTGYSFYAAYNFWKKFQVFARYDILRSNIINGDGNPWDLSEDGSALIAGIEYVPIKNVKIAFDYQDWYPYAANLPNLSYLFINLEIKI